MMVRILQVVAGGLSVGFAAFFADAVWENNSRSIRNEAKVSQIDDIREDVREIRQFLIERK